MDQNMQKMPLIIRELQVAFYTRTICMKKNSLTFPRKNKFTENLISKNNKTPNGLLILGVIYFVSGLFID